MAEVRPAILIDFNKLKTMSESDYLIGQDNPGFKRIEYKGYSICVPSYCGEASETPKGELLISNENSPAVTAWLSDNDYIDSKNVHPYYVLEESLVELEDGTIHLFGWENKEKHLGTYQAYYKANGDSMGLCTSVMYVINPARNVQEDLGRAFLNIKKL